MKFHLSAPSKTFLLGEYLAMETGQALIVATQPRFELHVDLSKASNDFHFHEDSPAGLLLQKSQPNFHVDFIDPHKGSGGFGRSSSEFLFAMFLKDFKILLTKEASTLWNLSTVMKAYRKITKHIKTRPSGADVMAQFCGGVSAASLKQAECQSLPWFEDLSFSIFHTRKKVPTHKHLEDLKSFNTQEMKVIYESALAALVDKNKESFLQAITSYRTIMKMQGLEFEKTTEKLEKLLLSDDILAAKGCGALGADVIICFHDSEKSTKVRELAEGLNLTWISDDQDLTTGFEFTIERDPSNG